MRLQMKTQMLTWIGVLTVALTGTASAQLGGIKVPDKLPGGGALPANPTSCTGLKGDGGARIEAFIAASARLQQSAASLEASVADACKQMAGELKVSTAGTTKAVCGRVVVDEKDRAPQHGTAEVLANGLLAAALEFADELFKQAPEGQRLPHQFGVFINQRSAQQAL